MSADRSLQLYSPPLYQLSYRGLLIPTDTRNYFRGRNSATFVRCDTEKYKAQSGTWPLVQGDVAQMVERSLSMREVRGSIPRISILHFENSTIFCNYLRIAKLFPIWSKQNFAATSGNRTRAARVAGEHSTTEPTLLAYEVTVYVKILTHIQTCMECNNG